MKLSRKQISRFRRGRVSAAKEVRKQLRIRNNLEKSFFRKLTSLFGRFVNTRAFLYKEFGQYDLATSTRDLQSELFPVMISHYRRVYKTIFDENTKSNKLEEQKEDALVFGRNVDLEPLIENYFRTREFILAGISANIAKRVENIIISGREEGLTLVQIARNIEQRVRPITRSRAATIARTETHNAAGFAHHNYHQQVAKDLGSNLVKRWAATNDPRTRSDHSVANGQIRQMDEDFEVGGLPMSHTGDPRGGAKNNINCRCVIIYVDELDVVQD
tara:strand:- start:1007 stop:1828 length:822 start_codon:yes stop_codon:yes gene_type:complete